MSSVFSTYDCIADGEVGSLNGCQIRMFGADLLMLPMSQDQGS